MITAIIKILERNTSFLDNGNIDAYLAHCNFEIKELLNS